MQILYLVGITCLALASSASFVPAKRASSAVPEPGSGWIITPPSRPLKWGDLNIVHTTDTHGWLLGHQKPSFPEPNYFGTFGDFYDFVMHLKEIADEKGVDLLIIDTGDVRDGTGLTDGHPPGGINAHDSNQFFKQIPFDLLTIGNHELYIYENTLDTHTDFVPQFNGRYLSSNVNISVPDPSDPSQNISVPVGERFAKFTTKFGKRVTSLGVLYDFTSNAEGTTVQRSEDLVEEEWFAEVISEEPDLFLLLGHIPLQWDTWQLLFDAVRSVHPTTPILMLGSHSHVRDCVQFDGRSIALQSGRYVETAGEWLCWLSVNFDDNSSSPEGNLTFSRRYLDANKLTYQYHTGTNNDTFNTPEGLSLTRSLEDLAERFELDTTYGISPRDYSISRDPYPSNGSLLSLVIEQAFPTALAINSMRATQGVPALYITNSGSLRFDVFEGPFTKNDQLTASPFTNEVLFVGDVRFGVARRVVGRLDEVGSEVPTRRKRDLSGDGTNRRGLGSVKTRRGKGRRDENEVEAEWMYQEWLREMYERASERYLELGLERRDGEESGSTVGYVTSDSCPGIGDDTLHIPLPVFPYPPYISSIDAAASDASQATENSTTPVLIPDVTPEDTLVDLVFVDFISEDVLTVLNELESDPNIGSGKVYGEEDVGKYSELSANEILSVFAQVAWN